MSTKIISELGLGLRFILPQFKSQLKNIVGELSYQVLLD